MIGNCLVLVWIWILEDWINGVDVIRNCQRVILIVGEVRVKSAMLIAEECNHVTMLKRCISSF